MKWLRHKIYLLWSRTILRKQRLLTGAECWAYLHHQVAHLKLTKENDSEMYKPTVLINGVQKH